MSFDAIETHTNATLPSLLQPLRKLPIAMVSQKHVLLKMFIQGARSMEGNEPLFYPKDMIQGSVILRSDLPGVNHVLSITLCGRFHSVSHETDY